MAVPAALASLAVLAGCGTQGGADQTDSPPPTKESAVAVLANLPVKGRAPMTGYDRARFGQAWLDSDRNGCDTRNDILGEFLIAVTYKVGTGDCAVLEGDLDDPYTGKNIHFIRGDGALVDIDHVVALGNAWVTGGFEWDIKKRAAIANDPMNLLPVDASANRQKGDGDAATWLPANKAFRCAYVARQIGVKSKYGLWVTAAEKAAMERVLSTCPQQTVLEDSGAPVRVTLNITDPVPAQDPSATEPRGPPPGDGEMRFENCDAARAAGAAPVRRGDPGYGSHLDRDRDGSACE